MRVSRDRVVQENAAFLREYVVGTTSTDSPQSLQDKTRELIRVNPDDQEASIVNIRFVTRMIIAVSDDTPDSEDILRVVRQIISASQTIVNGVEIANITQDAANAIGAIARTTQKARLLPFFVPVEITQDNGTYRVSGSISGSEIVEDDDEYEIAKVGIELKFINSTGDPDGESLHNHIGTDSEGANTYSVTASLTERAPRGEVMAGIKGHVKVSTNGAITIRTISAVSLEFVEMDIVEVLEEEAEEEGESKRSEKPSAGEAKKELEKPTGEKKQGSQ